MFARLRHRTVSGGNHQNGTVHLGSTRNHVLHVVGVPRAVDVCVVTVLRFVLNVCRVDGNAAGLFFGSRVNLIICLGFAAELRSENRADGSRQRGLAVVNVTDGAHVHMGLGTFKLTLCHFRSCVLLR